MQIREKNDRLNLGDEQNRNKNMKSIETRQIWGIW